MSESDIKAKYENTDRGLGYEIETECHPEVLSGLKEDIVEASKSDELYFIYNKASGKIIVGFDMPRTFAGGGAVFLLNSCLARYKDKKIYGEMSDYVLLYASRIDDAIDPDTGERFYKITNRPPQQKELG